MLFTADFETTTDPQDCRVWAYALCSIDDDYTFQYGNSLDCLMDFCMGKENHTLYFHNLKFDGEFILVWLFEHGFRWVSDRKLADDRTFTTLISDNGMWYSMTIYFNKIDATHSNMVTIYDSLKILPFSVEDVAKAFDLPISKLELDYDEKREIGHQLTEHEIDYIRNDVEIIARALRTLFNSGLNKMTQGSNALSNYKHTVGKKQFEKWFPIPEYDSEIRKSYKGGFTYLNPKYKNIDVGEGIVLDVNSLYPSVMYYCKLPYGEGIKFSGKYKKDKLYDLYVQNISCSFELKKDHIPTMQLKGNLSFIPTEYLTSSNGDIINLCLTSVDLELFKEHYNLYSVSYRGGWKFKSTVGLFTEYIDYWMDVKIKSTKEGNKAMRTLAKLMLNALYGKFALNPRVQSKEPIYSDGMIKYKLLEPEERNPIYIPVGTFITAWARYKTITSAQKVYDRFIYADTDSLHLEGTEIPEGLEIDDFKLGAWAHESTFKRARFLRQKSYIEDTVQKDGSTKLDVTCAGMPDRCKEHVTWENFKPGMVFKGKLQYTHVVGGIVLKDIDFTIKER